MNRINTTYEADGLSFPISYNFAGDQSTDEVLNVIAAQDKAVAHTMLLAEDAMDSWGDVLDRADKRIDEQLASNVVATEMGRLALFEASVEKHGAREAGIVVAEEVEIGLTSEQQDYFTETAGPLLFDGVVEYDQQEMYA